MADKPRLLELTKENIESEHICCAMSDPKSAAGVAAKKAALRRVIPDGFKFVKLDVRGKVFMEYGPAEQAFRPVEADGYTVIHCFWVSGQYKGKGHARRLLEHCISDSAGTNGLVVVTSSKKKVPFLTERGFFLKHGFESVDSAPPHFELLVRKFRSDAPDPQFSDSVRTGGIPGDKGVTIVHSDFCPFIPVYLEETVAAARKHGYEVTTQKLSSSEDVKAGPSPSGLLGIYVEGEFLTHEVLNEKRFDKLMEKRKGG
jgi:ribosomal protein S18 acetylase RimI-like enzyme